MHTYIHMIYAQIPRNTLLFELKYGQHERYLPTAIFVIQIANAIKNVPYVPDTLISTHKHTNVPQVRFSICPYFCKL